MKVTAVVLPVLYFAPVGMYAAILQSGKVVFDVHENFVKQTFRSRCEIYGANGKQLLSVPVERKNNMPVKDVRISYKQNWQKIHWRSIVSAYRNSPYFEYYADKLQPFFETRSEFLFELNLALHQAIVHLLKIKVETEFSEKYSADYGTEVFDLRKENVPAPQISQYNQVFQEKHGFIPNLSILDLLFNCGPDSSQILRGKF